MKAAYNKSQIIRPAIRALVLISVFVGPFAGFAAAAAAEGARGPNGVGFLIYVSLLR